MYGIGRRAELWRKRKRFEKVSRMEEKSGFNQQQQSHISSVFTVR